MSSAPASSAASSVASSVALAASTVICALRSNIHDTELAEPRLPPARWKAWRISATVRLTLSVVVSIRIAAPPGPYPSYMTSSYCTPSSSPVPFLTARSMLSDGMFSALAASMAVRRRALPLGSPPPCLAAIVISRISLVKAAPRLASVTAFLRLICFHLLWPAMAPNLQRSPIRVEHVFEPHPAPVEVQVHADGRGGAGVAEEQL